MYKERVKCAASNFLPGQRILLQLLVRWQHLLVILVTGTIPYEHRWMERAQIGVENTVVRVLLEDVANKKENENSQRHIKRKLNLKTQQR